MSVSTKAESYRVQRSVESKRNYPRPRTNSPFPPLKNRTKSKQFNCVKQSDSFNSSLKNSIYEGLFESKPSTKISLRSKYAIPSCQESNYDISKEVNLNDYHCDESSTPLSSGSFNLQSNNCCRNVRSFNNYDHSQMQTKQENLYKIHIGESKRNYISWKSIAVHLNDLDKDERDKLGFSPPCIDPSISEQLNERYANQNFSNLTFDKINKNTCDYLPECSMNNMKLNLTQKTVKRDLMNRKSLDSSSFIPQLNSYKMPNIVQNKSNYMNYSLFK